MQRGNVLLKQGDFDEAKEDFQNVVCRFKINHYNRLNYIFYL